MTELLWRCASCMQTCLKRSFSLSLSLYSVLHQNSSLSFLPLPNPSILIKKRGRERERERKRWRTTLVVRWVSGVAHRSLFQPGLALRGIMCVSASFSTYCLKSRERSWLRGEACGGGRERAELMNVLNKECSLPANDLMASWCLCIRRTTHQNRCRPQENRGC